MNVIYEYDNDKLEIRERGNGNDTEFIIKVKDPVYDQNIHAVRNFFDYNKIYTDVYFYTHSDHSYQIIVREDYYIDFILQLFKYQILKSLRWN